VLPVSLGRPLPPTADPGLALLSRCAAAGLRVPAGSVLLDDGARPGHEALHGLRRCDLVTVRPAVGGPVPQDDVDALVTALAAAYGDGRDVLILRAVPAVHAGTARLCAPMDVVDAVEGDADQLLRGLAPELRRLRVPALRRRLQRAHRGGDEWHTPLPPWAMRLSRLLRDVRRVLGREDVRGEREVEWADDGRVCWLLQVSAGRRLRD